MGLREIHSRLAKDQRGSPLAIPVLIASNWLFQSLPEMDRSEAVLKLTSTLVPGVLIGLLLWRVVDPLGAFAAGLILAHTLNWVLNDHLLVTIKNFGWITTPPERFESELTRLLERASKSRGIDEVYLIGSVSSGSSHTKSDLDIRLIRQRGIVSALRTYGFAVVERARAMLVGFPLDLYFLDSVTALTRAKTEEVRRLLP